MGAGARWAKRARVARARRACLTAATKAASSTTWGRAAGSTDGSSSTCPLRTTSPGACSRLRQPRRLIDVANEAVTRSQVSSAIQAHGASGPGHTRYQLVRGETQPFGHRVLLLEGENVRRPIGHCVQGNAGVEEHGLGLGLLQRLGVAVLQHRLGLLCPAEAGGCRAGHHARP